MSIEKQIADQVRQLPDKTLLEMALAHGFSLALKKPNGAAPKATSIFSVTGAKKVEKAAKNVAAVASQAAKPPRKAKTAEPNPDAGLVLTKLNGATVDSRGLSSGELAQIVGIEKGKVSRILKRLVAEGKAFKGGDRRFARYATTQKLADDASLAARAG
jgi:uncharacterized protein with PhoU and TrkA domain